MPLIAQTHLQTYEPCSPQMTCVSRVHLVIGNVQSLSFLVLPPLHAASVFVGTDIVQARPALHLRVHREVLRGPALLFCCFLLRLTAEFLLTFWRVPTSVDSYICPLFPCLFANGLSRPAAFAFHTSISAALLLPLELFLAVDVCDDVGQFREILYGRAFAHLQQHAAPIEIDQMRSQALRS